MSHTDVPTEIDAGEAIVLVVMLTIRLAFVVGISDDPGGDITTEDLIRDARDLLSPLFSTDRGRAHVGTGVATIAPLATIVGEVQR